MSDKARNSDCCTDEGAVELDVVHENRPGLPALTYRLGHHSDFFSRMLTRLPNQRVADEDRPPLGPLTYRGKDDPTIALIDACASMLDVLSFYQERIANEGFIRTAIERRSVLEMARSLGYELRPGVAASTLLSFTVDSTPGAPEVVNVPVGTQVMSIPKKNAMPQMFETVAAIEGRAEWNAMTVHAPRHTLKQVVRVNSSELFVAGVGLTVRSGDLALLIEQASMDEPPRIALLVTAVTAYPERGYTRLKVKPLVPPGTTLPRTRLEQPRLHIFRLRTHLFGHSAQDAVIDGQDQRVLRAAIDTQVRSVALSPVGARGASGFTAATGVPQLATVRIWNLATFQEERALDVYATITSLAFSPDGVFLAAGDDTGHLYVWRVAGDEPRVMAQLSSSPGLPLIGIGIRGGAGTYDITAVRADGVAECWQLSDGDTLTLTPKDPDDTDDTVLLSDVVAPPDPQRLLLAGGNGATLYRFPRVVEQVPGEIRIDGDVDLEALFPSIVPRSWIILRQDPDTFRAYEVDKVSSVYRSGYGLSGQISRLRLYTGSSEPMFSLRGTLVYAESEELPLAGLELTLPVAVEGDEMKLADEVPALEPGKTVIIQGRISGPGVDDDPPTEIQAVLADGSTATFTLTAVSNPARSLVQEASDTTFYSVQDDDTGLSVELALNAKQLLHWQDDDELVHEIATVDAYTPGEDTADSVPTLSLTAPLQHRYDWRSVRILANVAPATHGETAQEVLGSGDGLMRNQAFKLRKPPLTYVPGAGANPKSTLEIRVNGVTWKEHDSLLQLRPTDEAFIVRIQDDGATHVIFGDGDRGARLPTGAENIVATYRSGLGPEGEVEAGQLALLKTRPLGLREVTNVMPATGAESAESRDDARMNAPDSVKVLGRVVSIQDYEDFTRAYPGVGKALAVEFWDGRSRVVHLTVGTAGGAPLDPGTVLYTSLLAALDKVRDASQKLVIQGHEKRFFRLSARVLIDSRYLPDPVLREIRAHLASSFSFATREFGQDVTAAEIVTVIHRVAGVVAVDLDELAYTDSGPPLSQVLEAGLGRFEENKYWGAELLLIDPASIHLEVMQ